MRSLVLGNGTLTVGYDAFGEVRDIYFPYVGFENHVGGHNRHRIGVWADGRLHWLSDGTWRIKVSSPADTFTGDIHAEHEGLGVALYCTDVVYNEKNIFLRRVRVHNMRDTRRTIKVYFGHEFELYESHVAHTAYFDPLRRGIFHYRGSRVFLIRAAQRGDFISDYTTGVFGFGGRDGSYRDAEDGALSQNPIEHGPADSVIGMYDEYEPGETKELYYWLSVGKSHDEVRELDDYVVNRTPAWLIQTTSDFWRAWVKRQQFTFWKLPEEVVRVFNQSLFIVRAHTDASGAIIASTDSDILQNGKDNYDYMWPRDAARAAVALYLSGSYNAAQRFFSLMGSVISAEGFFMHKYGPDGTIGSSWHPFVRNGKPIFPIQEDETALVIYALWDYYELSKDIDFVERIYNTLIKQAADFMVSFRDPKTGLPKPSYDLWEERYGIHTFTAVSTAAALAAASKFAALLGKGAHVKRYHTAAQELRAAIERHLYDAKDGFCKGLVDVSGELVLDHAADMAATYSLYAFGVFDPLDARVEQAVRRADERLSVRANVSGIARYEGDSYMRADTGIPGNPWTVTTLWRTQYDIVRARSDEELESVREDLARVASYSLPSGVLPEQFNPRTGEHVSASPLTWSQSEFVITVLKYLTKLEELGVCPMCNPVD